MGKGFFDVLQDENESSDSSASGQSLPSAPGVTVPTFEDLSLCRGDEETVLTAVYGPDFTCKVGAHGRATRLNVHVRPPDTKKEHIGSHLILSLKLHKQYPYVMPTIQTKKVQGLSASEEAELLHQLTDRAKGLSKTGCVMMVELVQVAEDYLLSHNRDPTLSAWEQMKQREDLEKEQERRMQEEHQAEMNRLLNHRSASPMSSNRRSLEDSNVTMTSGWKHSEDVASSDIKRELNRQTAALEDARRLRQDGEDEAIKNASAAVFGDLVDDDYSDDQSENDDDVLFPASSDQWGGSGSRYLADFVEMGILGRGGGGEVVKVRNRLDRRTYAIKKIILESERGVHAKAGAVQNRKLRREVTTISRMTHKNIVRYYQAWVEGDDIETIKEAGTLERGVSAELDGKIESSDTKKDDQGSSVEDSVDDGLTGYWSQPPMGKFFLQGGDDDEDEPSGGSEEEQNDSSGSEEWSDAEQDKQTSMVNSSNSKSSSTKIHSQSVENLLQMETDFYQSPLLAGIGFQRGELHHGKKTRQHSNSTSSPEDFWDESSSVKVDSSLSQRILYIQMEYCSR